MRPFLAAIATATIVDLTIEPAHLEEAFLEFYEETRRMNGALFRQTWRAQRLKLAVVSGALVIWGFLMPLVYAKFGAQFRAIMESGMLPVQAARFGGGDIFSLPGSIALGLIHPIAIILTSVFSVGFSATAIAGERQRGTLEVALARPIARRTFYLTLLEAAFGFVAVTVAALLAGSVTGATFAGVIGEFPVRNVPLLWLNGVLLFGSFTAVGLAASASFDRVAPALGVTLGFVVLMYFLEILGSLWPAAEMLQPYSLFHYLKAKAVLRGAGAPFDSGNTCRSHRRGCCVGAAGVSAARSRGTKLMHPPAMSHYGRTAPIRNTLRKPLMLLDLSARSLTPCADSQHREIAKLKTFNNSAQQGWSGACCLECHRAPRARQSQ